MAKKKAFKRSTAPVFMVLDPKNLPAAVDELAKVFAMRSAIPGWSKLVQKLPLCIATVQADVIEFMMETKQADDMQLSEVIGCHTLEDLDTAQKIGVIRLQFPIALKKDIQEKFYERESSPSLHQHSVGEGHNEDAVS